MISIHRFEMKHPSKEHQVQAWGVLDEKPEQINLAFGILIK